MAPAAAPAPLSPAAVLAAARVVFPEIGSQLIERARGTTCVVLASPEGWAVRVPRSQVASAEQLRGMALLGEIAGRLPVAVPVPCATITLAERRAVVYRWLPGEPGGALTPAQLSGLGEFLHVLHGLDLAALPSVRAEAPAWRQERDGALERELEVNILARLSRPAATRWRAVLARVRATAEAYSGRLCLLHGDLERGELLWDGPRLVGVTDWDDWLVGDPAWDLRFVLSELDPPAERRLFVAYGADPPLIARAHCYAAAVPLLEAHEARRQGGDAEGLAAALQRLERRRVSSGAPGDR